MYCVSIFCFLGAVFSIVVFSKELAPFLNADVLVERQQTGFNSDRELRYGYSSKSKFIVLNDCLNGMNTLQADKASLRTVRAFASRCAELADNIVKTMPSHAHAWLVKAWAGAALFDGRSLNDGLQQSQLTGPNELWIAKMRIDLAERHLRSLDPRSQADIRTDIVMMAGNQDGSFALAQRYRENPDFRARVVPVIETLPNETQSRFIENIKMAGRTE